MATNKEKIQDPAVVEEPVVVEEPIKEPVKEPVKVTVKAPESIYTAADLAANHRVFKAPREIVVVALRLAGKETATFEEAKTIIENFKNKEVK